MFQSHQGRPLKCWRSSLGLSCCLHPRPEHWLNWKKNKLTTSTNKLMCFVKNIDRIKRASLQPGNCWLQYFTWQHPEFLIYYFPPRYLTHRQNRSEGFGSESLRIALRYWETRFSGVQLKQEKINGQSWILHFQRCLKLLTTQISEYPQITMNFTEKCLFIGELQTDSSITFTQLQIPNRALLFLVVWNSLFLRCALIL